MISFELLQCDDGWEWVKLPDNMVIEFTSDSEPLEFHAALRDIVIFAAMVREKEYGEKVFGIDGMVWMRPSDTEHSKKSEIVKIGAADVGETVPYEDALRAVESLLFDAFARHDELRPEERTNALRILNIDLERRQLPPIAHEPYAEWRTRAESD